MRRVVPSVPLAEGDLSLGAEALLAFLDTAI